LSADFGSLDQAIRAAETGGADALHLDVMDGHFVPNISFGPALVGAVRARTKLPLDVHLMISHPLRYVESFRKAGGDTLVFHMEADDPPAAVVRKIREAGGQVGAAIRPTTPFAAIEPMLAELDEVLVMSVNPGFSGQKFMPEVLPKVEATRKLLDDTASPARISIDGGVTAETAVGAARAGATFFVCGNSVYNSEPVASNLARLRSAVESGARDGVS
jgi:ribulose-phosphate 3-epimerase